MGGIATSSRAHRAAPACYRPQLGGCVRSSASRDARNWSATQWNLSVGTDNSKQPARDWLRHGQIRGLWPRGWSVRSFRFLARVRWVSLPEVGGGEFRRPLRRAVMARKGRLHHMQADGIVHGDAAELLPNLPDGSVDLFFTSPAAQSSCGRVQALSRESAPRDSSTARSSSAAAATADRMVALMSSSRARLV